MYAPNWIPVGTNVSATVVTMIDNTSLCSRHLEVCLVNRVNPLTLIFGQLNCMSDSKRHRYRDMHKNYP